MVVNMIAPEELLPALKTELGEEIAKDAKEYNLLKYLRWKSDVSRASERYKSLVEWRKENTFALDSDPPLLASKDPALKRVLESGVVVAPKGMVDVQGRTVLVGRVRNNDMTKNSVEDVTRMAMYTVDRVLEDINAQTNGVVLLHDLEGISRNNVDIRVPKMLIKALMGHFPIRLQGVYLYKAPFFYKNVMFPVVALIMPTKLRARIKFIDDLDEIHDKLISRDQMLEEHGGKRVHDPKAWVAAQIEREKKGSMQSLADCPLSQEEEQ